jgi:hypothetical protein
MLLLVSLASGCATTQDVALPLYPPNADVKAAIEPKPIPSDDIVTDPVAAENYNAAVEGWGDRVQRAGARICRWIVDNGGKLPFPCPAPDVPPVAP